MSKLTKQEWEDWLEHPATVEFFARVKEEREDAIRNLANGIFSENPGKQNIYVGLISGLTKLLDAEYTEG